MLTEGGTSARRGRLYYEGKGRMPYVDLHDLNQMRGVVPNTPGECPRQPPLRNARGFFGFSPTRCRAPCGACEPHAGRRGLPLPPAESGELQCSVHAILSALPSAVLCGRDAMQ